MKLSPDVERGSHEASFAERVLVLTPTGDDAALITRVLKDRGFASGIVHGLADLARELESEAGIALIASEAFDDTAGLAILRNFLDRQEPWSELPVLLFSGGNGNVASLANEMLGPRAQIVILERPLAIATLLTATDAALRSRQRQYEVKRLLDALAQSAVEVARAHEQATRAKDEFLATLGHELRSPMTAIRGWIDLLKAGDLTPEDATMALSMIESSTRVQSHIIEDLMDISRIIAGKVMIDPAVMELGPLVKGIVATFTASAAIQGIALTSEITEEPLFAHVDGTRLQQVGWNLVSNAIKFTPSGGNVHVTLRRAGDRAEMRVRDSGEGIASELLPHVFERYRQAEGGSKRPHGGLGLGLAIVRHLMESHSGTVEAFSDGLGKGAEFLLSLPLTAPEELP